MADHQAGTGNAAQIEFWNSAATRAWADQYARMDRAVAALTKELLDLAAPQPGEHVLDIGCGPGTTVLELAKHVGPGGHVLGADVSESSVSRARERIAAAGLRQASEKLWPNAPLEAVRHLLPPIPTPGPEEPGPFSWADLARVHRILEGAGFGEVSLTPLDPVIQLAGPTGEAEAADFVMAMGPLVRVLPSLSAAQRANVRATLEVYFRGHTTPQGIVLPAAIWVVRARV